VDAGRAFGYVFEDPRWVTKLVIGAVMVLIPIVGWLVLYGYALRIIRNVVAGDERPLPEWEDFGGLLGLGFAGFVVSVVWSVPAWLLASFAGAVGRSSTLASLCLDCLVIPVALLVGFVAPAAVARTATTGSINAGLEFGPIVALVRDHATDYLLVVVLSIAASIIAGLGVLACVVGALFTYAYAVLVLAHLYGQAYRRATGEEPALAQPRF